MINAVHKALLAILIAAGSAGVTATWGQDAKINADVVRKAILAVPIWHIDRNTGTSLWHFEMRGDKLWAKIANIGGNNIGDLQVDVTSDGLTWSGPDGARATIHYDPQDIQFPFKGTDTQGRTYEFTPQ
jgi:outer membrane protein assembly factor BamB